MFRDDHARLPAKLAGVGCDEHEPVEQFDPCRVDASGQREPDQMRWHGGAIGGNCDHAFTTDLQAVKEAVIVGHDGERAELRLLGGQQDAWDLLGRIGRAHRVNVVNPACAFVFQLGIVVEGATS